jgi:hypothetical protein
MRFAKLGRRRVEGVQRALRDNPFRLVASQAAAIAVEQE